MSTTSSRRSGPAIALAIGGLFLAGCTTAGPVDKIVTMRVGQTGHLTAYRNDSCGAPAPSWASVQRRLPSSSIVSYSDGGLSSRNSRQCGKRVPTRAINATGIKPGSEVNRYQDTIEIVVR